MRKFRTVASLLDEEYIESRVEELLTSIDKFKESLDGKRIGDLLMDTDELQENAKFLYDALDEFCEDHEVEY